MVIIGTVQTYLKEKKKTQSFTGSFWKVVRFFQAKLVILVRGSDFERAIVNFDLDMIFNEFTH